MPLSTFGYSHSISLHTGVENASPGHSPDIVPPRCSSRATWWQIRAILYAFYYYFLVGRPFESTVNLCFIKRAAVVFTWALLPLFYVSRSSGSSSRFHVTHPTSACFQSPPILKDKAVVRVSLKKPRKQSLKQNWKKGLPFTLWKKNKNITCHALVYVAYGIPGGVIWLPPPCH